jgi:phospho-N-acetylmuramoyl-pentapeptide-transferase
VVLCPIVIPFLRKLKFGQFVRDDGPQSHLKKAGTPTMGGLIILVSILLTSLLYIRRYSELIPVLFMTLGFGIIGFLDDYIKVVMKRSLGLKPLQKMFGQFIVTVVFVCYYYNVAHMTATIRIPFMNSFFTMPDWLFIIFVFIVVLGTVNGVNFTDGLDGLASSVTLIVAVFFTVVSLGMNSGVEPITCAVVGSLMGFLLFNVYPAKVFMGDTGSLALGGFVAGVAYAMQMPLFIILVGLIYLIEVLSVMIQVSYFKATHGKRIFKMAPIHHHFELCGWSETRVVAVFSVVTAIMCLIALLAL